ncbi:hypothetical protein A9Q84_21190 [Halobacteriovorax marinus]|uniref:PilZ domain-containing protein n=1 Tax=Halobacteriovorax marinus TaxID=97084 RepID=A0A1Y5F7C7_9BACT|nr:hypothetical protein A9Q84_21190 [Halobacteriovorax marinus]
MNSLIKNEKKDQTTEQILEAYKSKYSVYAWGSFGGHVIKADLEFKTIKFNQKKIVLVPTKLSRSYLEDLLGGSGKLNIAIPQMSLLFEAEYLKYDDDLTITFPLFHKFYDRRKSERVDPFIPLQLKMNYKGITYKKTCSDIGVGGLSIILSRSEMTRFMVNDEIKDVELSFPLKNMIVEVKVASLVKLNPYKDEKHPYGGSRLSLSFSGNTTLVKKEVLRLINGQKKLVCDIDM